MFINNSNMNTSLNERLLKSEINEDLDNTIDESEIVHTPCNKTLIQIYNYFFIKDIIILCTYKFLVYLIHYL